MTEAGRILLDEHSSGTPHMRRHILAIEHEAQPFALDREAREAIVRSLRVRYGLRQSIPELMMGLDIALAEQGR